MNSDKTEKSDFALRHSSAPYQGMGIILSAVCALVIITSFQTHTWRNLEAVPLVIGFFLLWVLMGLWYRVGVRDGVIWQRVWGRRGALLLPIKDITSVGRETTSDIKTAVAMNKSFARIAIEGVVGHKTVVVDVSLKHFVASDIRRLMQLIHKMRPDLTLPKKWLDSDKQSASK